MFYMVFNDRTDSRKYNVQIEERPSIPIAEDDIDYIKVPGADELLTKRDGFLNRTISVKFSCYHTTNLMSVIRPFISYLRSVKSFYFSDDTTVEYRVKNVVADNVEREVKVLGKFTINFIVDPFCYYRNVSTIDAKTVNSFVNVGDYFSRPYIKITCDGTKTNQQLVINDLVLKVKTMTEYVEIDSKSRRVYKDSPSNNLGDNIEAEEFPTLIVGTNNVSCSSGITHVYINPRWRCF